MFAVLFLLICCEAGHTGNAGWRNVFALVQVLLFHRGIGSHSAVYTTALGRVCLGLMRSEHFLEKLISCTLVARVLFVPLT